MPKKPTTQSNKPIRQPKVAKQPVASVPLGFWRRHKYLRIFGVIFSVLLVVFLGSWADLYWQQHMTLGDAIAFGGTPSRRYFSYFKTKEVLAKVPAAKKVVDEAMATLVLISTQVGSSRVNACYARDDAPDVFYSQNYSKVCYYKRTTALSMSASPYDVYAQLNKVLAAYGLRDTEIDNLTADQIQTKNCFSSSVDYSRGLNETSSTPSDALNAVGVYYLIGSNSDIFSTSDKCNVQADYQTNDGSESIYEASLDNTNIFYEKKTYDTQKLRQQLMAAGNPTVLVLEVTNEYFNAPMHGN